MTGDKDKLGTQLMTMDGDDVIIEHAAELAVQLSELPDQLERWAMMDPPGTVIALEKSTMGIAVVQELSKRGGVVVKELGEANEALVEAAAMSQRASRPVMPIVYVPQVGNKLFRTSLLLSDARHGRVKLVEGAWNALLIKRYVNFRNFSGDQDDLIDAGSNARRVLMDLRPRRLTADEVARRQVFRDGPTESTEERRRTAFERLRAERRDR